MSDETTTARATRKRKRMSETTNPSGLRTQLQKRPRPQRDLQARQKPGHQQESQAVAEEQKMDFNVVKRTGQEPTVPQMKRAFSLSPSENTRDAACDQALQVSHPQAVQTE